MELSGRYHDGQVALTHPVRCRLEGTPEAGVLVIRDIGSGLDLDRWPVAAMTPMTARGHDLRIAARDRPAGARLVFTDEAEIARAHSLLPGLMRHRRAERGRKWRTVGLATGALASFILAYVFGVPLLASRIVALVPPEWEAQLGETVIEQFAGALGRGGGLTLCDPDPDSLANRAIRRFADAAVDGSGTPFTVDIAVVDVDVPNAFALPGGQVYYFSGLLERTQHPDEFAGVLAHEIGHVVHRHGMEKLIAGAGTGLLIGFVLGDITGVSIAGAVGTMLIDNRFSRESERQADRFAAGVADRLAFRLGGLPDLLDRMSGDDPFARAMALLSTHPLTEERRATLEELEPPFPPLRPAFDNEEWMAIRAMCDPGAPAAEPAAAAPGKDEGTLSLPDLTRR